MKQLWHKFGWIVMTIVGSAIFGAGYAIFLGPNDLNAGGISGLAAIIVQLVNPNGAIPFISVGILTICINLPLFAIGGVKIGKKFFFGSLLGLALSSTIMDAWPAAMQLTLEPLLAALYGGAATGFGLGLVFKVSKFPRRPGRVSRWCRSRCRFYAFPGFVGGGRCRRTAYKTNPGFCG